MLSKLNKYDLAVCREKKNECTVHTCHMHRISGGMSEHIFKGWELNSECPCLHLPYYVARGHTFTFFAIKKNQDLT